MTDDTPQTPEDNGSIEAFPEDAQRVIKELRAEAAKMRVQRNDYRAKFEEAGSLLAQANEHVDRAAALEEEKARLLAERDEANNSLMKLRVAAKYGLVDHVDRLKGNTEEELTADAESFSKTVRANGLPRDPASREPAGAPKVNPIEEFLLKATGRG